MDACRLGAYRPAHRTSDAQRRVRALLVVRDNLVRARARQIQVVRALTRREGLRVPSGQAASFADRLHEVELPEWLQRTLAPMIAGAADMHYGTFLFYNIIGGLFWAIGVTALGYWLGNTIPNIDHYLLPILGVIGLLALSPTIVRLLHSQVKQRQTRE